MDRHRFLTREYWRWVWVWVGQDRTGRMGWERGEMEMDVFVLVVLGCPWEE